MQGYHTDRPLLVGGAYLTVEEGSSISCRVDPGGEIAELTVFGPMELGLNMSEAVLRRCRDVLGEACEQMRRARSD